MIKQLLLLIILLSLVPAKVLSQNSQQNCEGLFCSDEILNLQLDLYFDSLLAGGVSERLKYGAVLRTMNKGKTENTFHIQLSKRGHFRKFPNICDFPPLRLHFDDSETNGTVFQDLNKIKMVTHCQNNDTAFDQYVLQEYLIYKAYNLLTDYSFKTRLARITYKDLSKTFPDVIGYTFFIENPGSLEKRLNGTCLNVKYIWPKQLDQRHYALTTLFEYMMINQDWSVSLIHNLEIFADKSTYNLIPIPFDFDMCGIIAIPYKSPTVPFKKGVKPERNYMGKGIPKEMVIAAIDTLRSHKNDIIKVFNTSPLLTPANRKNIIGHLTDFYDYTGNMEFVRKVLLGQN